MSKKIKSTEIYEEQIYIWTCPECGTVNSEQLDIRDDSHTICECCEKVIEIES